MNELWIYGASDDLIEVRGVFDEEFSASSGGVVLCSTGTIVEFAFGMRWVARVLSSGSAKVTVSRAAGEDDVVSVVGDVRWVALASQWVGEFA